MKLKLSTKRKYKGPIFLNFINPPVRVVKSNKINEPVEDGKQFTSRSSDHM